MTHRPLRRLSPQSAKVELGECEQPSSKVRLLRAETPGGSALQLRMKLKCEEAEPAS